MATEKAMVRRLYQRPPFYKGPLIVKIAAVTGTPPLHVP
jgi:hypothetical protein